MGIGGAVLGGILGALVGGPVGGAMGALLGHSVDPMDNKKPRAPAQEQSRQARHILAGLASMLARVAHADREIDARERALILDICRNYAVQWGLGKFLASDAELEASVDVGIATPQAGELIIKRARTEPRMAMDLLHQLWRVAAGDGRIDDRERTVLGQLARELGLSDEQSAQVAMFFLRTEGMHGASTSRERRDAATVLGVSVSAAPEEVKRAYRALAMKWHPDRHPNNVKDAQERTASINHARDVLFAADAGPAGESLLAWSDGGNALVEPKPGDVVRCFLCETRNRLPAKEHLDTARCGRCQALVLYGAQLAQRLFAARH